jgi:poly(A) polymerase
MAELPVPPESGDPAALALLIEVLDGGAGATRYIGGWVRDTLLGLPSADIDVATRLPPEEAAARARAAGLQVWTSASGIAHGTIGVVIAGRTIEVTTLRRDLATDGRHATVAFTDDWREDAARRDFTINALSADPLTGAVHDYFGGLDDLAAGVVRFIGDPATRIAEDHLRILRFFRFHARFGKGPPDVASYAACAARAKDLMALSRERIAAELLKLLAVPNPVPAIEAMLAGTIFAPVLPEIIDTGRLPIVIVAEADAGTAPDGLRRLAALLPPDPALADRIAARLKLSKADRKRLELATDADIARPPPALAYRLGLEGAIDRLLIAGAGDAVRSLADWQRPRLAVSGGDLIARGLDAGPIVATTLKRIEQRWLEEDFPDGGRLNAIIAQAIDQALRSRQ